MIGNGLKTITIDGKQFVVSESTADAFYHLIELVADKKKEDECQTKLPDILDNE